MPISVYEIFIEQGLWAKLGVGGPLGCQQLTFQGTEGLGRYRQTCAVVGRRGDGSLKEGRS